jgi:hypothetical protein
MTKQRLSAIYPLFNYDIRLGDNSTNQKFIFSNSVVLRKITRKEVELFLNPRVIHPTMWSDGADLIYRINENSWVYEVNDMAVDSAQSDEEKVNHSFSKSHRLVFEVELGMKLHNSAPGFCKLFIIFQDSEILSRGVINPQAPYKPNICVLQLSDLNEVNNIVTKITHIDLDNNNTFRIACERLSRSFEERREDDKIIDMAIAFEALFTDKNNSKLEYMGKFVGLGCSMLMGKDSKDREAISNFIQKAFSVRNNIVHGNRKIDTKITVQNEEYTVKEFTNKLQYYLKQAIIKLA